jgi:hypothetical protein
MKNIIIYIFLSVQAFLFVSCHDELLKEDAVSVLTVENKFATLNDFELALTGVYQTLGLRTTPILTIDPTWGSYAYGMFVTAELGTDEMRAAQTIRQDEVQLDSYTITPLTQAFVAEYAVMNLGISRANQIASRLDTVTNLTNDTKSILGETLFLRSLFYFNLVRTFGGVPLILKPLTANDWSNHMKRDSIQTIYTKMISDLNRADTLLLPSSRNSLPGRVNNIAVKALLAKIYLQAASMKTNAALEQAVKLNGTNSYDWVDATDFYQKSAAAIETVFQRKASSLTTPLDGIAYSSNFWPTENGTESIFEVQFINSTTDNMGGLIGSAYGSALLENGRNYLKPCSYQYYQTCDPNDLRYKQNVTNQQYIASTKKVQNATRFTSYGFIKYHNGFTNSTAGSTFLMSPQNLPILRLADLCLMYAEAKAEISTLTGNAADMQTALDMLNAVRRRARGTSITALVDIPATFIQNDISASMTQMEKNDVYKYIRPIRGIISMSFTGTDVGDINVTAGELDSPIKRMRALIMNERKWELVGEGHRWFDLVRMGWLKKVCDAIDLTYTAGNPEDLLNLRGVKSHHVFRPIPQREVDMGMLQNYGY